MKYLLLLLCAMDLRVIGQPGRADVTAGMTFTATIVPRTALSYDFEHLWGDTYRIAYKATVTGPYGYTTEGEFLAVGRGDVALAVADELEIRAPSAVAVLPVRVGERVAILMGR